MQDTQPDSHSATQKLAFVTGATGFIGQHLVRRLLDENWKLRCLARSSVRPTDFAERVEWVLGDLDSPTALEKGCRDADVIFHLGGIVKARRKADFYAVNQLGTRNVIEAAIRSAKKSARFILVSSQAAAGPGEIFSPKKEEQACYPVSLYGQSKLAAEIEVLRHRNDLHCSILRPAIVYGPGDRESLRFFKLAKSHINPKVGPDTQIVSLIHVTDVVALLMLLAQQNIPSGEIYFASDDKDVHTLGEVMQTAKDCLQSWMIALRIPLWLLKSAAFLATLWGRITRRTTLFNLDKFHEITEPYWNCSAQKARNTLGFVARYDLSAGFTMTADWYRLNDWL